MTRTLGPWNLEQVHINLLTLKQTLNKWLIAANSTNYEGSPAILASMIVALELGA